MSACVIYAAFIYLILFPKSGNARIYFFHDGKTGTFIDVTDDVKKIVEKSGLNEGTCLVYAPHSTAAIIINENWDPGVCEDVLSSLSRMVPKAVLTINTIK